MASTQNTTIAKNTLYLSIRMVFVLFVSLYTSRVFLRVLGVEDFGINNVVCGFVAMFGFLNTSLANGIQRFYNSEMSQNGSGGVTKVYNSSLIIQSAIALLVFVLLESAGLWYLNTKMVIPESRMNIAFWIYQFSVISSVLTIMQSPYSAAVMAYEKMNYYALVSILDVVLKLLLAFIIPYVPLDKLLFYGFLMLLMALLNFTLYFAYSKRKFSELRLQKVTDRKLMLNMVTFSGWNFWGTFACMMREQGLNMVLNLFFGPIVNAARGIAYQVSSALQGFVQNISIAAKPQMVSSYAGGNANRTVMLMYTMSKLSFLVLLVMAVPICIEIDYILHLWLGDVVPEHTAAFVILVVLTNFWNNLNAPLSNVVYATGKMRNYEVTFSILNILIIPLAYLVLHYGFQPESAFLVYLVMTIVVQAGCLIVLKTLVSISLREYVFKLLLPLLACAMATIPLPWYIHSVMDANFTRVCVVSIATIIVALISFYYIALNSSEREVANSIIRKIKK